MTFYKLPKVVKKGKRRVGRGYGSGRGKTAGRGTKGQNARGGLSIRHPHYEGGQRSLYKRLPYKRGKGNPKILNKPLEINLKMLDNLPKNTIINLESLSKFKIVDKKQSEKFGVKILGDGNIRIPLEIHLPISKSAAQKIITAGGKIVNG